jgi:argininosuccinate lyase
VHFDYRLAPYDLRSSLAHLSVLESSGLVEADDASKIANVLRELMLEVSNGDFGIQVGDEDIHSALERAMMERIGDIGGKLRAGRSRNDQVASRSTSIFN